MGLKKKKYLKLIKEQKPSKRKIKSLKNSAHKVKTKIFFSIEFLLMKPDFIQKVGFKLLDCIRNILVLGEEVSCDMIGGEFSIPEKEFMIKKAKMNLKHSENSPFDKDGILIDRNLEVYNLKKKKYISRNKSFGDRKQVEKAFFQEFVSEFAYPTRKSVYVNFKSKYQKRTITQNPMLKSLPEPKK